MFTVSKSTPFDYPSKEAITSNENEKAAWLEMLAPQREAFGTEELLPDTKLITRYINKYHTIDTINPKSARVKNTLKNRDYMINTIQKSQ